MPTKNLEHYLSLSYPIELRRNPEHGGYFAFHPDLEGCMAEGATAEEAIANLGDSRELWLELRFKKNYPIPEPLDEDEFSGRISLRMMSSLHSKLAKEAARRGISLNLLINTVLAEHAGGAAHATELAEAVASLQAVAGEFRSHASAAAPSPSMAAAATTSGPAVSDQSSRVALPFNRKA